MNLQEMPESRDRIVHVNATMELNDYFHASFDAARTKLVIACVIVATVIAAFSYFFILIGEHKILWQLSPLFFGLPIVAVGGQFLRAHASYRKIFGNYLILKRTSTTCFMRMEMVLIWCVERTSDMLPGRL
jgi:hypothetical protein